MIQIVKAQHLCCWTVSGGKRCNQPTTERLIAICRKHAFSETHHGYLCKKHIRSNQNRRRYKTFRSKILQQVKDYQAAHPAEMLAAIHKRSRDYNGRLAILYSGLKRKHRKRLIFQLCDLKNRFDKMKQYHVLFNAWVASQWQDDLAPVLVAKGRSEITISNVFFATKLEWHTNSRKTEKNYDSF